MTALYQLTTEYRAAAERLHDLDLDDQTIADTLEGMAGAVEVKARNVAFVIRNCEALADQIKQAEEQMAARRKAIENRATRIRNYLLNNMQACGISKIECPEFKLSIHKNPGAVVIDAEGQIPCDLFVYPEAPPPRPDKKAIADRIKAGKEVPGAHLEVSERLEIK